MKKVVLTICIVMTLVIMASSELRAADKGQLKPTLFAKMAPCLYNVDGLTVCEKTGKIFLNVPNFSLQNEKKIKENSHQGGYLVELNMDGSYKVVLVYPVLKKTGQCGPMGLDFGPDGNLYVCDNQYFYDKNYSSRILRVIMKNGEPTGEVQVVVRGLKLANAILWYKDKMYITDTALDTEDPKSKEIIGCGGIWNFDKEEILKAGTKGVKAIQLKPADKDSHMLVMKDVYKIGRGDDGGADGMTVDSKTGVIYFGHFGNGQMFAIYPDKDGKYTKENTICIYDPQKPEGIDKDDPVFQCCDGIYYDAKTDLVFINDSMANAIRYFAPVPKGQKAQIKILAINGDTDGNDGSLDQPCECVVVDGKMIIANFDWPFPGLKNTKVDLPGTISVIDLSTWKKK